MSLQIIKASNPLWWQTLKELRHDIYHLPEYFDLESRRIKAIPEAILITNDKKKFFLPYLLRSCNDILDRELPSLEVFDVVSPYGYPGVLLSEAAAKTPEFLDFAINELINMLRARQVCSAFFRLHPILNHSFNEICQPSICQVNGETVSIDLKLSESEIWQQTKSSHRNKINRCKRAGLTARMVPFQEYINEFNEIYEETMTRVGATHSYYFGSEYLMHLKYALRDKLHLCIVELNEQITCVGLFTECCKIVQYHLGGTRTTFLNLAPSKLMFDYVRFWAKERGNEVFHLGGGVGGSKDSLYHFKANFSEQRHTFMTLRIIVDKRKYLHLAELRAKYLNTKVEQILTTKYFPAYRCHDIN